MTALSHHKQKKSLKEGIAANNALDIPAKHTRVRQGNMTERTAKKRASIRQRKGGEIFTGILYCSFNRWSRFFEEIGR